MRLSSANCSFPRRGPGARSRMAPNMASSLLELLRQPFQVTMVPPIRQTAPHEGSVRNSAEISGTAWRISESGHSEGNFSNRPYSTHHECSRQPRAALAGRLARVRPVPELITDQVRHLALAPTSASYAQD